LFDHGLRLAVDCANEARDQVVVNKGSDQVPVPLRSQPPPPTANPSPQLFVPPASQPKISDRVGQPPAQSDTAQPVNSPGSCPVAAVAQRVVLYEEDPADPKDKQYVGSVIWRTEPIKARGKPDIAVRADIEIPDRKFKMTMLFRRNLDSSLPASHTAELTFILPPDFSGGGVGNLPGILMKSNERAPSDCPRIATYPTTIATTKVASCGTPLAGLAVRVTDGFFLVALSNVDADRARNIRLLTERSWFDVPLGCANQRRATIAIEKGMPGERAFKDAFAEWGSDRPSASAPSATNEPVTPPPLTKTKTQDRLPVFVSPPLTSVAPRAPVDVNATSGPRIAYPPRNQNGSPPPVASVAPSAPMPAAAANGTMPSNEPRRIKTLSVKGDAADAGIPASAPPPPATKLTAHDRTALSDARTSVQTYYSLTPDCNQSGTITVRVLEQPSQGTLEIARDRGFTNYAADNIRAKCNAQEVELTRVWYKSNADFKGRDQAQLEAFFTSGTSIKTTLQITVK
jgi:hypothetical protein